MIAWLRGRLIELDAQKRSATIDVQGVGYAVFLHNRDVQLLQDRGETGNVTVYCSQVSRQDVVELYGFLEKSEKPVFLSLVSVNGLGAKMAMTLLGLVSPGELAGAIAAKDASFFKAVPGIGPKLAGRMIVELGSQIKKWPTSHPVADIPVPQHGNVGDLRGVLLNLGYGTLDIERALRQGMNDQGFSNMAFEDQLRWLLKALSTHQQPEEAR